VEVLSDGTAKLRIAMKPLQAATPRKLTNSLGMEFVRISSGSFMMGNQYSPEESTKRFGGRAELYKDERPRHRVTISRSFYLQSTEVTRGQFRKFVEATGYRTEAEKGDGLIILTGSSWEKKAGSSWRSVGFSQSDDHPVVGVSWNDAQPSVPI
jgi:formylglycine-generating enzyme